MRFHIRYICVALLGAVMACPAYAQCCDCEEYDGCPFGDENIGSSEYPECHGCGYAYDCSFCNWCADFTDTCPPGVPSGRVCKVVTPNCGQISGCTKYELCNPNNGLAGVFFVPVDVCHLENDTCYANTRSCASFDISVVYGAWNCRKTDQQGDAGWDADENAWNTSGCSCSFADRDIEMDMANTVTKCRKANASYYVADDQKFSTKGVTYPVYYTPKRQYCAKCYAGYLPTVVNSPQGEVYFAPSNNSQYGVRVCGTMVPAPNYAPGCDIPSVLSSNAMPTGCMETCPTGMETIENGASSVNDCVPNGATTYTDETGTFRLGTDASVCH